jgi:hypothetical protein
VVNQMVWPVAMDTSDDRQALVDVITDHIATTRDEDPVATSRKGGRQKRN